VAPVRRDAPAEAERAARVMEDSPAQRLRALENAIASQRSVEFTYGNGTARVKVQPLHVLRNREPMKLIAVDMASGHRNEYALDQMQALRVGEMA
jgi:predicted DNA-binding transcriptional regulator YafY